MPSFFLMIRRPPRSPLFPYPPLFRSWRSPTASPITRRRKARMSASTARWPPRRDRKSTRLNSSHGYISYAIFFFNDTAPPEISPLPLPAALPILAISHGKPYPPQTQGKDERFHRTLAAEV